MVRHSLLSSAIVATFTTLTTAVQDLNATSGAQTVHYRKHGSGPPLVFIHGFPDNAQTWDTFQVPFFSPSYTVLTPTLRGYLPSSVPLEQSAYRMDLVASDILAVIEAEGLDNVTLVAHDWGGSVASAFAQIYANRTRALVLMNTGTPTFADLLATDAEQQEISRYTLPFVAYQPGQPKNISSLVQHIRNTTYAAEIAEYLDASPIEGMMNYYKESYPQPPYPTDNPFVYVSIPSLLLWGEQDPYFSNAAINDLARHYEEGLRLVTVPEAGHWVFRDQYERVNREIQSFLDFWGI